MRGWTKAGTIGDLPEPMIVAVMPWERLLPRLRPLNNSRRKAVAKLKTNEQLLGKTTAKFWTSGQFLGKENSRLIGDYCALKYEIIFKERIQLL